MEQLKLLFWDLDGTVWSGALLEPSSGSIDARSEVIRIISDASERGIIHIAISHNPTDKVNEHLKELALANYFISVIANFDPKASQIQEQIIALGLRPESCLFLDDNLHNRKMARHLVPKLQTINPSLEELAKLHGRILKQPISKIDRKKLYSNLLKRSIRRTQSDSHDDFLATLKVQLTYVNLRNYRNELKQRRDELCERAYQLNYTREFGEDEQRKRRQPRLADSPVSLCIFAADKYGDHGFIGYVEYHRETRQVIQFVFSCRVLNLEVESFVFHDLQLKPFPIPNDAPYPISSTKPIHIKADAAEERVMNNSVKLRKFPRILTGSMCFYQIFSHRLGEFQKFTVKNFSARILADLCNKHMDGSFDIAIYYAFHDHIYNSSEHMINQAERLKDTSKAIIIVLPFDVLSILEKYRSEPSVDAFFSGDAFKRHLSYTLQLKTLKEQVYRVAVENSLIHIIEQEDFLSAELKIHGTKILDLNKPTSNQIYFYSNPYYGSLARIVYEKMLQIHETGYFGPS